MPKEGFETITLPDTLVNDIDQYVKSSNKLISSKSEAIKLAWIRFREQYATLFNVTNNTVPKVKIGNKIVGDNEPVFIIAEIGINHNGDIEPAKKLIDLAVEAGCDAVKFQKRTIDIVYTREELAKPRENPFGSTNGDLKRGLEFGEKEYTIIDNYCKEKNILWFASCWDEKSVDFIEKFNPPCYKIASPSLTDDSLLRYTKSKGRPIIMSTGMSTIDEIKHAIDILGESNTVILHCTSTYPCKIEELNLKTILYLKQRFNCPIGYSGHEVGLPSTVAAATIGASLIERHITLGREQWGSDQAASLEPAGVHRMVRDIRMLPVIMGDGIKRVYDSEVPIKAKLRRVG
jgi:N-acetylneuraminate synthase